MGEGDADLVSKEFEPLIKLIGDNDRFILTAHETPDGDAIGSEYAMFRALKQLGKQVVILNADPAPQKFTFVDVSGSVSVLTDHFQLPEDIADSVLLILDTKDINNIGRVSELVLPNVKKFFIIDHHESDETIVYGEMVQMDASSTSEILYQLFEELGIQIDYDTAQALFMGIVYDTGSFIYPKTSALTMRIASDLVARGVRPNEVYTKLYETNTVSALFLQSKVLASLELEYDNQVAIQTMLKETIVECRAKYEEADQLINMPLKAEEVRVSVFFKQNLEGLLRCSLRSKGNIDVAEIALQFGGGGHRTAAGFKCRASIEETKKIVLQNLEKYFV